MSYDLREFDIYFEQFKQPVSMEILAYVRWTYFDKKLIDHIVFTVIFIIIVIFVAFLFAVINVISFILILFVLL